MKIEPKVLSRRSILSTLPLGVAGTILLHPTPADAFFIALIFRVATFGYGRALFASAAGATILAVGAKEAASYAFHSIVGRRAGGGGGGGSYDSHSPNGWKEYRPPEPIIIQVSLKPSDRIPGDVLRILAIEQGVLKNDGITLPHGGKLVIEEDGKMQFVNTKFRGYAYMQNNRDLTVWTPENTLVLTHAPRDKKLHSINQDSDDGRLALTSLIGDIRHV